jgi:hypothetical protein
MRITSFVITAILTVGAAACGGGGDDAADDGDDGDDAPAVDADPNAPDAPPGGNPDAPPGVVNALGQACTGMGQGDCPPNHVCIGIRMGGPTFCSPSCTMANDTCNTGYTGPGFGYCLLTTMMGSPPTQCGIICNDNLQMPPDVCPPGECNDTCPGTLECSADLMQGGIEACH